MAKQEPLTKCTHGQPKPTMAAHTAYLGTLVLVAGPQPRTSCLGAGRRVGTKLCKGEGASGCRRRQPPAAAQWQDTPTTQCSGDAAGQLGIVRWLVVG
jgi:hypothetical protein